MKSIADLKRLREESLKKVNLRSDEKEYRIVVGMATCGIAAGARPVLTRFMEEASKTNNCIVAQTGCIGLCVFEPIVEIYDKQGHKTTYVHINPEKASEIFKSHIIDGVIKEEYTIQNNRKD